MKRKFQWNNLFLGIIVIALVDFPIRVRFANMDDFIDTNLHLFNFGDEL